MTSAPGEFEIDIGSGSAWVRWEAMSRSIVLRNGGGRQVLRMNYEEAAKALAQLDVAVSLGTGEGLRRIEEIVRIPVGGAVA